MAPSNLFLNRNTYRTDSMGIADTYDHRMERVLAKIRGIKLSDPVEQIPVHLLPTVGPVASTWGGAAAAGMAGEGGLTLKLDPVKIRPPTLLHSTRTARLIRSLPRGL